ncbi:MAG TPA: hypothetical protein DF613_03550 [Lachnospiraceae bacterium]|nr:hypothetical protein [Lachnospiraceae bacterium]
MEKEKLTGYQYRMSLILGFGYTGTCGLAYFATMFHALFVTATGFSEAQVGTMLSLAGICTVVSVLFGGVLADYVNPKRCLQFAYFANPILAMLVMFNIPSFPVMLVCYCALGLMCQMPKWCPMCKLISLSGTEGQQARLFSWYACFSAIGTFVITLIGSAIVARFSPQHGFKVIVALYSGILIISGILLTVFVKVPKENLEKTNDFTFGDILNIFKTPRLLLSFVAAAGIYITFFAMSYINPMLGDVFGMPLATMTLLATLTGSLCNAVVSPVVGTIADKIGSVLKLYVVLYIMAIGSCFLLTVIPWAPTMLAVAVVLLFLVAICQHGSYSIYPAILSEIKAPKKTLGTSTGLMSTCLSAPDVFVYAMAGSMLTKYGNGGYRYMLWFACGLMLLGFICTIALLRMKKKNNFGEA